MGGDKSVPEKLHENYRNKCDDEEAKTLFDNVNPIRQRGPPRRFISSFANVRNGMMFAMLALFILYDKVEQISRAVNQQMQSNDHYRKMSARSHYNSTVETSDVVAGHHYSPMSSLAQLQEMIDSTDEVIITMPAKAAGSSLKQFADQCYGKVWVEDNYLNFIQNKGITGLTSHYELPKVMASHMYTQNSFIHLIKNVPNKALMIYSHREETDRLLSAINEAMTAWCRENVDQIPTKQPPGFFSKTDGNNCYVLEKDLIEKAIKLRKREIGVSGTRLLTCTVYNTLETNAPNLFFMDYRKAGELMNRLAQKYCPALIDKPVVANTADEKAFGAFVQVESDTGVVTEIPLREWLNVKRGHLELLLGLNNDGTCRAKTRLMEKMLFSSEGGFVSVEDVIKQFHISLKL